MPPQFPHESSVITMAAYLKYELATCFKFFFASVIHWSHFQFCLAIPLTIWEHRWLSIPLASLCCLHGSDTSVVDSPCSLWIWQKIYALRLYWIKNDLLNDDMITMSLVMVYIYALTGHEVRCMSFDLSFNLTSTIFYYYICVCYNFLALGSFRVGTKCFKII